MNPHALDVLEFEKVRRMILRWTFSIPGRARAEALAPDLAPEEILRSQRRILEWRSLELRGEAPGATVIADLRPMLARLGRGSTTLEAVELYGFLPFLNHVLCLRRAWDPAAPAASDRPELGQILSRLADFSEVRRRLERSIASSGEILDSASPELARVRQELFRHRQQATALLEEMRGRLTDDRDDTFVTLREGRYVLSLRTHHRSAVPGLLHGRSQSGQSLLVEPLEAVEANNRVAEAREEEKREEARIVRELSSALRERSEELAEAWEIAGRLDLIRAQARLAMELRAEAPELNSEGRLRIVHGRHPILAEAEARGCAPVVPLDLEVDSRQPILLVSGPNMGGKTVALKTVGLLVLMARAGLLIPAADGTDLPLIDEAFADLGDEQSIESDLSTFAGHLRNIGELWRDASARSLVILDELGGGTDPEEGAALAMAVLEGLAERGTLTLATTHLSSVKLFVSDRATMRNGAMEFDPVSMTPRFRLRIGEPGTSRAFDIARRILPAGDLLDRAERYRSPLLVQMEELFGRVEAERRRVELERESLEADRRDLAAATERRRQQADRLRERLQRIRTERAAAAGRLYEEAQAFVRGLKESLEQKAKQAAPQATLGSVREAERELQERARATTRRVRKEPPRRLLPPERITSGEEAWVQKLRAKVRIDRVAGDRVWIDWGGRRFEVGRGDLEELPVEPRPAVTPPKGGFRLPDLTEEPLQRELDLRGCRAAEALEKLDSFLDRARLQNLHQVRIVHGKGTGALKREVERHLAAHPLVASFRTGELGEGSWGVTVATLGPSNESTWR